MIGRIFSVTINTARLNLDPVQYFRGQGVEIGDDVEIFGASLNTFGSEPYLVSIGNHVTISHAVDFITHDGGLRVARMQFPDAYVYGRIRVADNCFLGAHTILLPGASVGEGSVIGSGSIVAGKIPPGVVAIGAPARPIKSVDQYVDEKRALWLDTRGLTPSAKKRLLVSQLPNV